MTAVGGLDELDLAPFISFLDNVATCGYILAMKTVGLRELKNRLGVYMRQVRAGEAVAITDRGEVVAHLTPPQAVNDPTAALKDMARRGEVRLPKPMTKRQRTALYADFSRPLKSDVVKALLDEDRGER